MSDVHVMQPLPHISRANLKRAALRGIHIGPSDKAPRLSRSAMDAIFIATEVYMDKVYAHVSETMRTLKRVRVMPAMVTAAFKHHGMTVLDTSCH